MVDTEKLKRAVRHYEFTSTPSSGTYSDPANVGDIRRVVENTAKVLKVFIEELESAE